MGATVNEKQRARFEAAHVKTDLMFTWDKDHYWSDVTQRCWFSWQAALESLDVEAAARKMFELTRENWTITTDNDWDDLPRIWREKCEADAAAILAAAKREA